MSRHLYTIGHSTHTMEEFLDILRAHKIRHIVDVRTVPKSHHVPWFNAAKLAATLRKEKINYTHMPALGSLRHANKHSLNSGWHNASFRGFADYMQTPEFFAGLCSLNSIIKKVKKVAIMCAEAVPWRCHRSLIADAEVIRHIKVFHIMSMIVLRTHQLTSFAIVQRNKRPMQILYPVSDD